MGHNIFCNVNHIVPQHSNTHLHKYSNNTQTSFLKTFAPCMDNVSKQ